LLPTVTDSIFIDTSCVTSYNAAEATEPYVRPCDDCQVITDLADHSYSPG
jgi:hypothetical protein